MTERLHILAVAIMSMATLLPSLAQGTTEVTVRVDFAQSVPTHSLVGFLHGVTESAPSESLIRPLNIQYWRGAFFESLDGTRMTPAAHARLQALAPQMKTQYLMSDEWGYTCCRPTVRWPFENYAVWETFVADSVRARLQAKDVIPYWEVWNEPTVRFFWPGSMEQFFETYARTYRVLRQQLGPDAPIAGPSLHHYNRELITRFLDYCLANRLEVNILSWHENNDRIPTADIVSHVQEARALFMEAEKYRPLRLREIHIDEYGGPPSRHSPGAMLNYLYYLEAARVDAAAKSCWKDSKRRSECFNGSLDGLVDVDSMRPRSVWWAYKLYADGASSRVASSITDPGIVSIASRASETAEHAQVLVGHSGRTAVVEPRPVDIVLENLDALAFLPKSSTVAVTLKRLAPTAEQPSNGPEMVQESVFPPGGKAQVVIPRFGGHEVYVLDISAGPSLRFDAKPAGRSGRP